VWSEWEETAFFQRLLIPGRAERSWAVVGGLRRIADDLGATVAQLAIAWVLHQAGVTCAIAGSRSGRHTEENAAAAGLDIKPVIEDIERLIPLGPSFA
jgi:aryl-alcohol dehydrogenase-like predicted oxidoreductase